MRESGIASAAAGSSAPDTLPESSTSTASGMRLQMKPPAMRRRMTHGSRLRCQRSPRQPPAARRCKQKRRRRQLRCQRRPQQPPALWRCHRKRRRCRLRSRLQRSGRGQPHKHHLLRLRQLRRRYRVLQVRRCPTMCKRSRTGSRAWRRLLRSSNSRSTRASADALQSRSCCLITPDRNRR